VTGLFVAGGCLALCQVGGYTLHCYFADVITDLCNTRRGADVVTNAVYWDNIAAIAVIVAVTNLALHRTNSYRT
jgi:hypothetical protein